MVDGGAVVRLMMRMICIDSGVWLLVNFDHRSLIRGHVHRVNVWNSSGIGILESALGGV